ARSRAPAGARSFLLLTREELERFAVAVGALAEHAMCGELGDHAVAAPRLSMLDVGEVHLHDRHLQQLERVADCVAVVAPGSRVDDDAVDVVVGVVDPLDELALAVRLPAARVDVEGVRPGVDAALELVQADPAVDLRVAPAEHVEVGAVQDEDLHQRMRLFNAARTSSAGSVFTVGPSSASSTTLISPPARFLSCSSASQARSRSTRTGFGSSASRTRPGSRPLSSSAASSPSATASPWGSSKSAAASSAWPNVWPRFSHRRGPRSYGSRRQSADLYAAAPRASRSWPASSSVFKSSVSPFRRSRSGSVSRRASSITTRAGQWNAPARFLPFAVSTPVLPPIAASTCPTSVVGTATHGTPRRYVAAAKPAGSVSAPPPSATTVPSRSRLSSLQSPWTTGHALAFSPDG